MNALRQDLRYAVRVLRRSPAFLVVAVATVALGIAGTTTVFSLINVILFRPLPFPEGDRLVAVSESAGEGADVRTNTVFSYPRFRQLHDSDHGLAGLAAEGSGRHVLQGRTHAQLLEIGYVSANYFDVLRIRPALGRFFAPEEDREPGASPVAVLSHSFWQSEFGGDPAVIGQTLILDRQPATVIGVAPPEFTGLPAGVDAELWLPVTMYGTYSGNEYFVNQGMMVWLRVFGRLAPGDAIEQAEARLSGVVLGLGREHPSHTSPTGMGLSRLGVVLPGTEAEHSRYLGILLGMSVLVLMIAAANVGGMLLARATSRSREMSIRLAVGAARARLVRQLLIETSLVFLIAGGLGLWLTFCAVRAVAGLEGLPVPLPDNIPVDLRVVGLGLGLAVLTALVFGLAPALQATRPDLISELKVTSSAGDFRKNRLRSAFVVGQIALSVVLLVAAGLFLRALQEGLRTELGFDAERVVALDLWIPNADFDPMRRGAIEAELLARIRGIPSVEAAAFAHFAPFTRSMVTTQVEVPGRDGRAPMRINSVSPDYFRTMGTPLIDGRHFHESERNTGTDPVMILNQAAARLLSLDQPVGRELLILRESHRVIGLVSDLRQDALREEPVPLIYIPYGPTATMTLHVRSAAAGTPSFQTLVRETVASVDPDTPIQRMQPMSAFVSAILAPQRVASILIGGLGAIGLALAALGIYGVLTFDVARRTREIGVRIALGGGAEGVARRVVARAARMVAAGVGIGVLAAVAVARTLEALLLGVSPIDPLALGVALGILIAVAMLASYLPARRASRVDPMIALRAE